MTLLERQVHAAQRRLWLNRWLHRFCFVAALGGLGFAVIVLIQRLFDLPLPIGWIGVGAGTVAVVASIIWTVRTREDAATAAARLDEAAGLRERISSGRYCLGVDDPFAQAVVADAERVGSAINVRQHIRLSVPSPLAWTAGSFVLSALMFLVTPGLLKPKEAVAREERREAVEATHIAVKKQMDQIREMTETTPALDDLKPQLADMDSLSGKADEPADIRHEALKKIDRLEDAVRQKRASDRYDAIPEMQKRLRGLKVPDSEEAPTQKLAKALNEGDFKTAKEEVQKLREQLATLKSEEDKEAVTKLSKQLDDLTKQIDKLAKDEKLAQKLEQAGLSKEDIERMLERLSKKDLEQIQKKLEESGMSREQIEKIAKQLQQNKSAGAAARKLAQSMKQGAKAADAGEMGNAMEGLSQAAEQLGELEQLEQEMNQLEATADALQQAKNDIDKPCSSCGGSGMKNGQPCKQCGGTGRSGAGGDRQGSGSGMGKKIGQGRGGKAEQEQTDVAFKTERQKVHTGKGAIIGQFLFEGEQIPGEASSKLAQTVSAAEREASDLIHRDRVPRQYHKAVKAYFSNMKRDLKGAKGGDANPEGKKSPEESTDSDKKDRIDD